MYITSFFFLFFVVRLVQNLYTLDGFVSHKTLPRDESQKNIICTYVHIYNWKTTWRAACAIKLKTNTEMNWALVGVVVVVVFVIFYNAVRSRLSLSFARTRTRPPASPSQSKLNPTTLKTSFRNAANVAGRLLGNISSGSEINNTHTHRHTRVQTLQCCSHGSNTQHVAGVVQRGRLLLPAFWLVVGTAPHSQFSILTRVVRTALQIASAAGVYCVSVVFS